MAKRQYIAQDKHAAELIRRFVRQRGLVVTVDGSTHTRISTRDGKMVGVVSTTARGQRNALNAIKRLERGLERARST